MSWPTGNISTTNLGAGGDPALGQAALLELATQFNQVVAALGGTLGVCPLDSGAKVDLDYLPSIPATLLPAIGSYRHAYPFGFNGQVAVTDAGNALIAQKAIYFSVAATITELVIGGVDGLDAGAVGSTIVRVSDAAWDGAGNGFTVTLAAGASNAVATGSLAIAAGGWAYVYVTQATGGHYGLTGTINALY